MKLLFLGTGASAGIPMIGCTCSVCRSQNPKNKRLRPSALLEIGEKKILIDPGPDFRAQALCYGINDLDGVLITHTHFDHIGGIDELRAFYILKRKALPILASKVTVDELKLRFYYLFKEKSWGVTLSAQLEFQVLEQKRGSTTFLGEEIGFVTYEQGGMEVTGFRIGNLAYLSDIRNFPETIFEDLEGIETLVISTIGPKPSFMHFSLEEACSFIKRSKAKKGVLMHISHELEHEATNKLLPEGITLAYDGLEVGFSYAK